MSEHHPTDKELVKIPATNEQWEEFRKIAEELGDQLSAHTLNEFLHTLKWLRGEKRKPVKKSSSRNDCHELIG